VAQRALIVQLAWLAVLACVVACVSWTVTHEQVFEEVRAWCMRRSHASRRWYVRKWYYLFTCEYCFSHYVAAGAIAISGFELLLPGWRGAVIAWFTSIWIANIYMSLFGRLRLDIKRERVEIAEVEAESAAAPDRAA
jgi:hypothetical protein